LDSNLLIWAFDERIQCFWNEDEPSRLELVINDCALARLIVRTGKFADKKLIENSIIDSVALGAGYLAPMDEDFPDEIVFVIESQKMRVAQHHIIKYGPNYAIHLNIYEGYSDIDIDTARQSMLEMKIKSDILLSVGDQLTAKFIIDEETRFSSIGQRRVLETI